MRAHLYLGEVLRLQGRFADAATLMREGEMTARSVGLEGSFGRYMLVNAADDLFHLGRWGEAAEIIDTTAQMELAPWSLLMRHIVAGRLAVAMGAFGAAGDHLRRAQTPCHAEAGEADFAAPLLAARAELALWRGQADEARGFVATATAIVTDQTDHLNAPVLFWIGARAAGDAAEAARALGDPREEARAVDEASRTLAALDALSRARCHRACAADGQVLPRVMCRRGESRPWRARSGAVACCRRRLGDMRDALSSRVLALAAAEAALAADGERHAATADLRRAHTTAAELKAEPLLRQTVALATRARLDLGLAPAEPTGEPPRDGAYGLTPRKLEVLALIGKGLTKRQIGEHLFISQKTAGVHVSHILAKLDVHTRATADRSGPSTRALRRTGRRATGRPQLTKASARPSALDPSGLPPSRSRRSRRLRERRTSQPPPRSTRRPDHATADSTRPRRSVGRGPASNRQQRRRRPRRHRS